jgi:hypothetical protein
MATIKRNFPNDYFAWFNDDNRVAIVSKVLSSDIDASNTTNDVYDTYIGSDVTSGIRMHYHAKYTPVSSLTHNLTTNSGLNSGLHPALIDYVKSRLLEDAGDLQRASYFKGKYEKSVKQWPHRKSGVRNLAVPRL